VDANDSGDRFHSTLLSRTIFYNRVNPSSLNI
jgi:hypothetical protein